MFQWFCKTPKYFKWLPYLIKAEKLLGKLGKVVGVETPHLYLCVRVWAIVFCTDDYSPKVKRDTLDLGQFDIVHRINDGLLCMKTHCRAGRHLEWITSESIERFFLSKELELSLAHSHTHN